MNADAVRAAYDAVCAEAGPGVTVVAATKYVAAEDMGILADAGVAIAGENRAQDLQRKHALHADAFRWHFIGALQSNKARIVNEICELVHAVDTDSAARRLTVPWLLEVNLAGEESKSGVRRERDRGLPRALPAAARADDDAAVRRRPRGQPPDLPAARRARPRARADGALDGHLPGLAGRGRGGRDADPRRQHPVPPTEIRRLGYHPRVMGFSDVWNRTLVYFGIAEDEEWDEDGLETQEELEREYRSRSTRQNVRRLPRRREPDGWTDDSQSVESAPTAVATSSSRSSRPTRLRSADTGGKASVHLVLPRSFNDAQQIADKFKDSVPVILNLQSADNELSKRLIDFASGLTYALNGSMQRVADKVFLLTPRNVEVSAEERARMLDKGGFFNQA